MKKLLILTLVLGMASMASAASITGLVGTLNGDDNPGAGAITLDVVPTDPHTQLDTYLVVTIMGSATLTSGLGTAAPESSGLVGTMADLGLASTYGDGDLYVMASTTSPANYATGTWIDVSYTGAVDGDVIAAYESDGASFALLDSVTIPEPATIALLCLGGLLLRKK